jgi:hypothetical protein
VRSAKNPQANAVLTPSIPPPAAPDQQLTVQTSVPIDDSW